MSTRSRAFPWFRDPVPIAKMYVEGIETDARIMGKLRPIIEPPPRNYDDHCRAMVRAMVRSRLDTKLVLQARLLDPAFDEECRTICPELPPLDPVTTAELEKAIQRVFR